MSGGGSARPPGDGPAASPPPAQRDAFDGLSLETSRADDLRRDGKLPLSSAEAAANARRGVFRWFVSLFRRKG
jgi:hypothetical protein